MKRVLLSVATLFSFTSIQASAWDAKPQDTVCESEIDNAKATLVQTSAGVEITLADKKFLPYGTVGARPGFKVSTLFTHVARVEGATLQSLQQAGVTTQVVTSLILSMPDNGERDMASTYASELVSKLVCR